jgi:cytochrome c oxidase subunit 2
MNLYPPLSVSLAVIPTLLGDAVSLPNGSSTFAPQSPHAEAIYHLGLISLVVFCLIFAGAGGAIFYAIAHFRAQEGEPDPKQIAGNRRVEIIWTAIPLLIVAFLFVMTARTMGIVDPPGLAKPDLIVTGHQFWWEARYPDTGAIVANEIHIPVGKPISVRLEASDVIHEFWVVELTRKTECVPGQERNVWLQADKPGIYQGVCSEFCGTQHAWMRFIVVAEAPEKFAAWQQAQLQPAPAPVDPVASKGLAIFQGASCMNCHAINGVPGAGARIGPDLTHLASRRQLGAGIEENTPANLRAWLKNPLAVKPGVLMPDYHFDDEQLTQLGTYFETLK